MNVKVMTPEQLSSGDIAVLGVPFDEYSPYMKGPAKAPQKIRDAYHSHSSNYYTEEIIDLNAQARLKDLGDLEIRDYIRDIEGPVRKILERGARLIAFGGDHSVSYPLLKAFGHVYNTLDVLHLDAHPDLYDQLDGNRFSNACPFARAMEDKLINRLVQVGIRTMNSHQREQARRFGVETVETFTMKEWDPVSGLRALQFENPVYISLDIDVLDPAFAPGVSHHEPGGLSTRELISIIQRLDCRIVGADIVEFNPLRDPLNITAMAAAKCFKELAGKMLSQ